MEKWFIKNRSYDHREIAKQAGINPFISKLLVNRDIVDIDSINIFLQPYLDRFHTSELMLDLVSGANIILNKIKERKKIRIVGDFDVDGIMSVYILYKGLKRIGADVDYIIPDRVQDGYGINIDIVKQSKDEGIDTIITCDNGIAALEQIEYAKKLGLTVIVTDHHDIPFREENGEIIFLRSGADSIINPKQKDCNYPFKSLCGAGIAFKLIKYLYGVNNILEESYEFLEYAAIASICDVVDLVDENRIIVKNGLERLNDTKSIGLKALINASGIRDKVLGVYHIGFIIGPTLNASGRLDTALAALDLLLSQDQELADEMAISLRALNEERKSMTTDGIKRIMEQIETKGLNKDKVLVVYDPKIHESIAGIIAGRIKETYHKPTIVLTMGKDGPKGSGRSIEDYNMFEELTKCKDLLKRYGGHPMAAGLTLDFENIERLRKELNNNIKLTEEDLIPKIYIDMQLPIEYINYKLIQDISTLEPFGKGNSKPVFGEKSLKVDRGFLLGANKNVLKLSLKSSKGDIIEGILFKDVDLFIKGIKDKYGEIQFDNILKGIDNNVVLDILYYLDLNEYMGRSTIQLVINNYRFK